MKTAALYLAILAIITVNYDLSANEQEDSVIELDGALDVSRIGDKWIKLSVPFLVKSHPSIEALQGSKPSSVDELFNPEFIDNLNLKITVCFRNEFKRKYVRGDKSDIQFLDYYSSELEIKLLKVDRNTKTAAFLLPSIIIFETEAFSKFCDFKKGKSRRNKKRPCGLFLKIITKKVKLRYQSLVPLNVFCIQYPA